MGFGVGNRHSIWGTDEMDIFIYIYLIIKKVILITELIKKMFKIVITNLKGISSDLGKGKNKALAEHQELW